MSEKAYFNSSVDKKDYAIIKDEAYRLGITVKQHISNIISKHANKSREEVVESNTTKLAGKK